ncbi:MAG: hypothetical protein C5B54_01335, partial [Acidobacteria bacterium]
FFCVLCNLCGEFAWYTFESMATSGFKSISRVDHEAKHSYGWFVRVAFRGKIHQRFFSDLAHKSRRKALKAAIKWRNKTERKLGKPRSERTVPLITPNSTTGVRGVRLTTKAMTRDGRKLGPVYEVNWSPKPGVVRRTSFSITKYGEREAFGRAYALRKRVEREMYGVELPPQPIIRRTKKKSARHKSRKR